MGVVALDLDGVVWRGEVAIPGSSVAVARLRDAGRRVVFVTNNSGATVAAYLARLEAVGIRADAADLLTSAQCAADLLVGDLPPGSVVHACAGPGVVEALEAAGFVVTRDPAVGAAAVVVGWHRAFDFAALDAASAAVRAGARLVATNPDPTSPTPAGLLPGNGALVAAVSTASGVTPVIAGKPEAAAVRLLRRRFGDHGVMVGDRPSTDGAFAAALGWPFALVLSGVTGPGAGPGGEPVPDPAPSIMGADLAAIVGPLLDATTR
ncbi:MAG: HAD-IIA family hydrolase [Actinomycetota bacterium]